MKPLRDKIKELLTDYYVKIDNYHSASLLDETEMSIFVSRLENVLQLHNHPFSPPDPEPFFITDEFGFRAATLKFQQCAVQLTHFLHEDTLWSIDNCYTFKVEKNRYDVRVTLKNANDERQTLNISQFVEFLKHSTEVPILGHSGTA